VSNLLQRTLTGAIFVIAVIGSILIDYMLFAGVFVVFTVAGLWEFYSLQEKNYIRPLKIHGIITGLCIFLITVFKNAELIDIDHAEKYYFVIFLYILILFIIELYRKSEKAFQNISVCITGLIYIAIPLSILISLPHIVTHENSFDKVILIGFFLLLWTYDTFAYLTGIWLGKHRLFERISPKKSWEGLIGGAVFCIGLAILLSLNYSSLTTQQWIITAILIIIFGTFGDLVESMLKRNLNIKDSGNFFPGHGGVLDRFDAVLLSAPFVYFYLKFFI